jgi:hypothetical protein
MSAPHQRGETLAGLFLFGYLGLILPVLGLGIATQFVAATTAMLWFAGLMLALLAGIALLHRSAARSASGSAARSASGSASRSASGSASRSASRSAFGEIPAGD